ncbi:unnamed protein product [Mycena citricolor]|uniref:Impact N-terminal domain-containing protein n=1 Tax=Mycena citricolor TaxID=2018698 RepID=A0AAD2K4I8_9AGAR|nr:unnamed protein product [Mycena citricolor]
MGFGDYENVQQLVEELSLRADGESVASEIEVLQSIYGDDAVQLWKPTTSTKPDSSMTRYEVALSLPSPHDEISIRILVSNVLDRCEAWYGEHLSAEAAGELSRSEAHPERPNIVQEDPHANDSSLPLPVQPLPQGMQMCAVMVIIYRPEIMLISGGTRFRPSWPTSRQIEELHELHILSSTRGDARSETCCTKVRCVNRTDHETIRQLIPDNDDDGETAAGGRLAHLLHILEVDNVLVVVTRYFGGIHLGPDRFKHINQAARNALELGGFLDAPRTTTSKGRHR